MNSLLLYLLESSILLTILYGLYLLFLRKETFFNFNRFFLISILVFSFLFPLLSFDLINSEGSVITEQLSELGKARNTYYYTVENWSELSTASPVAESSWWQQLWFEEWSFTRAMMSLAVLVYLVGLAFMLGRFLMAFLKIYRLKQRLSLSDLSGLKVAKLPAPMAPFSFLNTVFIPDHIDDQSEFDQILAHEKTHIQQRHSIDLIFVQLVAAFMWFNPVIWRLIKSLKQTHEYIADKHMLRQGFSLVEYQSLLLRQLISNNSYGLVHNFNLSFINKRIAMMSIKESGWKGKAKVGLALSCTLLMGVMTAQSNTLPEATALAPTATTADARQDIKFYIDQLLISEGLTFSALEGYNGEFKFEFDNGKEDQLRLGIELIRKGEKIATMSKGLQEGISLDIKKLLDLAEIDDYMTIDVMEGPEEAVKLYNFPLFRDGANWVQGPPSDLPPPPVDLFVNGASVSPQKGMSLSAMKANTQGVSLEYVLSDFVDFEVVSSQAGGVNVSLIRKGKTVRVIEIDEVERKATISVEDLLTMAKTGDTIMVQFGAPGGLQFGSKFLLE